MLLSALYIADKQPVSLVKMCTVVEIAREVPGDLHYSTHYLYIVCVLVWHLQDGRTSDCNVSVNRI
jgi:hypothetical protein